MTQETESGFHVGVVLPRGGLSGDPLLAVARQAETLGYSSVWSTEHIVLPLESESRYPFSDDGAMPFKPTAKWFEGMVVLGYVAAVTERIRLGTAVVPLFNRDPLSLAKQAATVDCLCGGRLELGIGAGWLVEEAEALGHPTDHRSARLDETIDILRKAWSDHPVEHHGTFYDFPALGLEPKPPQGADLPIWIGGGSPAALRTTATRATGNLMWTQDVEEAREGCARLKELREDLQVSAMIPYHGDIPRVTDRAVALREAGMDRLMLSPPGDTAKALDWLEGFRAEVMPLLEARAP